MSDLQHLLEQNRAWASGRKQRDPGFFDRLCGIQRPKYLWIGCSDSRVPANEVVGTTAGEMFVHRNVANIVAPGDTNGMAVVQYAVENLGVRHVIVCGHYGCGGVRAVLEEARRDPRRTSRGGSRRCGSSRRNGAPSSRRSPLPTSAGESSASGTSRIRCAASSSRTSWRRRAFETSR